MIILSWSSKLINIQLSVLQEYFSLLKLIVVLCYMTFFQLKQFHFIGLVWGKNWSADLHLDVYEPISIRLNILIPFSMTFNSVYGHRGLQCWSIEIVDFVRQIAPKKSGIKMANMDHSAFAFVFSIMKTGFYCTDFVISLSYRTKVKLRAIVQLKL